MQLKYLVLLIFFIFVNQFSLNAQSSLSKQPPKSFYPPRTELVDGKISDDQDSQVNMYKFRSQLSNEAIVEFYRELLLVKGFKEKERSTDNDRLFIFTKGALQNIVLTFLSIKDSEERTLYLLHQAETKQLFLSSRFKPRNPQRLKFMSVYPKAKQIALSDADSGKIGASYIAQGEVKSVIDFYLKTMSQFGWVTEDSQLYKGKHKLSDIISKGLPLSEDLSLAAEDAFQGIDINVEGATLSFQQKDKGNNCSINIIQFKDPPAILKQRKIADPEFIKKYGNILISLYSN